MKSAEEWVGEQVIRTRLTKSLVYGCLRLRNWRRTLFSHHRPPADIPGALRDAFTLGGEIPVLKSYWNDVNSRPLKWTPRSFGWSPAKAARKACRYYGETDTCLYEALERYGIRDREVVVGSEMPWYECICSLYGARITTIEYRPIDCRISGLTVLTPEQYAREPKEFDVAVSISSLEHDGLGRYGDPINPRGDLEAMQKLKRLLKPDGLLLLAVPVGRDALVWNAHRIYGRKRLPLLLDGWETLAAFGFRDDLFDKPLGDCESQPVFVLRPRERFA